MSAAADSATITTMHPGNEGNGERSSSAADTNKRTTSTTWEWRMVRVPSSPAAGQHGAPQALRWYRLAPWKRREWLTLKVRYRGGPESWIEVQARGSAGRFHGATSLYDACQEIWRGDANDPQ